MSCQFTIPIKSSLANINSSASIAITEASGTFTPTESGGTFVVPTFLGSIAGKFTLLAGNLNVTITDKPWLVSCGRIETELTSYLCGNGS